MSKHVESAHACTNIHIQNQKKKNKLPACESVQTDKLVNIKDLLMESAQVGKRKEDSDYVRQNVSSRKT